MNKRQKKTALKSFIVIITFAVGSVFLFGLNACTHPDYDIDALIQSRVNNVVRIRGASDGSGTLVDMRYYPYSGYHGIIITCYHVVKGHRFVEVALNTDSDYFELARLMDNGYDADYDIAIFETVLPISPYFASVLEWANITTLTQGQRVLTFGDARGGGVVSSQGVVDKVNIIGNVGGAVNQEMTLIRVTSQIVNGKSGGPTFDMQGRLIGINIGTRGGLGYLVPADDVRTIFERVTRL